MRAGTFHIFAVDGLRIGLLAGIGIGLLRALRMPRAVCGLLVVPVIWFYAGLTGWPASAVRAAVMMSIVIGGWAAEPARRLDQFPFRRRAGHPGVGPATTFSGGISTLVSHCLVHWLAGAADAAVALRPVFSAGQTCARRGAAGLAGVAGGLAAARD